MESSSAFLEYFIGENSAFVFIITQQSAKVLKLDSPSQLGQSVSDFRTILLDFNAFKQNAKAAFEQYNQAAFKVYQEVLSNAQAEIGTPLLRAAATVRRPKAEEGKREEGHLHEYRIVLTRYALPGSLSLKQQQHHSTPPRINPLPNLSSLHVIDDDCVPHA